MRKPKGFKDRTTVKFARDLVDVAQKKRARTLDYVLELVKEEWWRRRLLAIEKAAARREALKGFVPEKVPDSKEAVKANLDLRYNRIMTANRVLAAFGFMAFILP